MEQEKKRLFFALEVQAPWPRPLPKGRVLREGDRHLTLAFLGNVPYKNLERALSLCPPLPYQIGCVGHFTEPLFLPKNHPKVAAWGIEILTGKQKILEYQKALSQWLFQIHYDPINPYRPFLPHVTLARAPLIQQDWKKVFQPLPLLLTHLHLYESVGKLHYRPIWSQQVKLPLEELSNSKALTFCIRGESLNDLYVHALVALAHYFPPIFIDAEKNPILECAEDIEHCLNTQISSFKKVGKRPFKSIRFSPDEKEKNAWILDVEHS